MSERVAAAVSVEEVSAVVDAIDELVRAAVASASKRTEGGKEIDSWQVHSERVAYAATEVLTARSMVDYAREAAAAGAEIGRAHV